MKKILLLTAAALVATTAAQAGHNKKFGGFYVGGELGGGSARFDQNRTPDNSAAGAFGILGVDGASTKSDVSATGIVGGLNLGYGYVHAPSHVYFGVHLAGNLSGFKGEQNSSDSAPHNIKNEYKLKNSFSADFRLGYAFENALVYGLIGVISSKVEAETTYSSRVAGNLGEFAKGSKSSRKTGLLLGLGVEVPVANRFSIGGEYRYARYGDVKYDTKTNNVARAAAGFGFGAYPLNTNVDSQKVKPSSHSFVVTAKYRF